jgi:hypothetical protein
LGIGRFFAVNRPSPLWGQPRRLGIFMSVLFSPGSSILSADENKTEVLVALLSRFDPTSV